jgi:hypothetical protein
MLTVRSMPPPLTVRVAVRWIVAVFASAVTLIGPSLLPEAGETVIQAASSLAVQLTLEVTATIVVEPADAKSSVAGKTVSEAAAAACVMLTVRSMPPPLTVIVAVRVPVVVLASAVTLIVSSLLPEAGETVIHAASSLAVQLTLEVTATDSVEPAAAKSSVAGETVSDSAPGIKKSFQTSAAPYAASVPGGTCSVTADSITLLKA